MAGQDFIGRIKEIEKQADTLLEQAHQQARLAIEQARRQSDELIEQARRDVEITQNETLAQAQRQVEEIERSAGSDAALPVHDQDIETAAAVVAERIVNDCVDR